MKKYSMFLLKSVIIVFAFFSFSSCEKETITINKFQNSNVLYEDFNNIKGKNVEIEYLGNKISAQDMGDYYIFLGDIRLNKKDVESANKKSKSKAAAIDDGIWPNKKVYYKIQNGFPNSQRITDAIQNIQNNTNLTFVNSTNAVNYIEIVNCLGSPYSDWVGYKGGRQVIGIPSNATYGNVIHEFCHALGLFHEQCRQDRDNFIIVNYDNILPERIPQYFIYSEDGYSGFDFGTFDFGSIMLYPSTNTYNGNWSMTDLAGNPFSAQRVSLSSIDIGVLNFLYPWTVTINGPGSGYNGFTYTYTTIISSNNGLVQPYTYCWEISELDLDDWQLISNSQNAYVSLYDDLSFILRVKVTSANGIIMESQRQISNKGDRY